MHEDHGHEMGSSSQVFAQPQTPVLRQFYRPCAIARRSMN